MAEENVDELNASDMPEDSHCPRIQEYANTHPVVTEEHANTQPSQILESENTHSAVMEGSENTQPPQILDSEKSHPPQILEFESSLPPQILESEKSHPPQTLESEDAHPPQTLEPENTHLTQTQEYDNTHPSQIQEYEDTSAGGEEKRWPGWPGENVFRMVIPIQKVGSIIGRKGEFIKKITEETRARIKILDGPPGTSERAVMVSAKEEPDAPIPPAIDGLLKVHRRIVDIDSDSADAASVIITRLLLADTQAGCLIGKQGSTVKLIQESSNCTIRVLREEHLPLFALQDDSIVEIQGEPASVHKAVELIANNLRKFLVDRSIVGVFETKMQAPNRRANQNMPPPHESWDPQSFPMNADVGPGFGHNSQYVRPTSQLDAYYPYPDLPPSDRHPRQGPPMYGRDASVGGHSYVQPQQSIARKVTHHMQIPLSYAEAVIGSSGVNISYLRRASGAAIAVQETKGVPGEMTVEISGSASQVQIAQQLIQNSMAEAASSMRNPTGGSIGQGYNPYPAHDPAYPSPQSEATGHTGHAPARDYGMAYGGAYGY